MAAPVYKAVPPAAVHSYSWTGFYVGAHAGFGGTWLAGSGPNGSAEGILPGPNRPRESNGIITSATPTPATFTIDKAGAGQITYSDKKKSTVLNWLVSE
jgi:hypothetical protein